MSKETDCVITIDFADGTSARWAVTEDFGDALAGSLTPCAAD